MPLDPYFTSQGADKFTCMGAARAEYSAEEKRAADALLSTPERVVTFERIREALKKEEKVSRVDLCFFHLMKRRKNILSRTPIRFRPRLGTEKTAFSPPITT